MAKILIGNVKPRKGVDYFTPEDIDTLGETFAKKEDVADVSAIQNKVDILTESVKEMDDKFAPAYTYGTEDLEAGTTPLETGKLHFVFEE
ncbi:MAG: hypothetical protein IKW20_05420 [Bacteroidales bacterium]|nr:hypothetical protein [Bacteroidales bacterium]